MVALKILFLANYDSSGMKKQRPNDYLDWNTNEKDDMKVDKRFERVFRDPRFRKLPANRTKIVIDKRFKSMFTDKNFSMTSKKHTRIGGI
jgi:hypothetical protein